MVEGLGSVVRLEGTTEGKKNCECIPTEEKKQEALNLGEWEMRRMI
jgi:hypothetical protein